MKFFTASAVLILSCHGDLSAKQINFSKKTVDNTVQFNYQWRDQNKENQSLNFSINKALLFDRFRNFKTYSNTHAKRYIDQGIKKSLSKQNIPGVHVSFSGTGGETHIKLSSQDQKTLTQAFQHIDKLEDDLMLEYLNSNFYKQFISYDNSLAIKPDHVRFAKESVADFKPLKPLILAQASIQNIRKVSNYVLGFVQSIPYSTLESRVTSTGAGFSPPLRMLWENQGDCDSKVTLTATIFRSLMPRIKMMLVFIDNHALLAINIPAEGDELTIDVDGISYVLVEPTGPAMMSVGETSAESEFAIRNGRYYAEAFFSQAKK
ncbi:hypothetical protein [Cognaticolwellia mytili]|uniref:hypothetical protein n=1 Tax=Cognaticolwellia mytili TaxID=1888913 RepID=UPI001F303E6A|nr:hypothetical protein [Cognaticolwellia mytili]